MAKKVLVIGKGATCVRCHKKIGQHKDAMVENWGGGFYYYHPSCYKKGYEMYHGRYRKIKK
jgi:hypothetical protein